MIDQSIDSEKLTYAQVAEETSSGALVGGMLALPATWALTHPMLIGSPNVYITAGLVACLDSLAVVDDWRGKGIARDLVAKWRGRRARTQPGSWAWPSCMSRTNRS
ncbi:hypothetical protein AB0C81_26905 [Streptomyces roseoverticillatus]|uniref:hypothetical protein n=1 Tax=Streptomyces roseoverticillatus TaxID=66429 RepID=UPI0033DE06B3